MSFASGENVGAYRIVEKLGQGGMATVYKAYHPSLDRYVAIKVMHPAFMEDPNFLARFQREARIVAKLDHPHIIPIYDFAEHKGHPYLVMRFIEGETLKARVERGPLEPPGILRIVQAVGEALTYAHGQGVLHRDIKPSNVLLTPEGGVYLTDFGLARMAEAGESTLSRDMMVGTPQYISPEQAKGLRELDARTDIYSLGVVLYELLVGQVPFTADTPYAIVHDHIFTPLPLPRQTNPDLPEPLERMLLKALAKEPDDRYQAVEDLIDALETAMEEAAAPETPETIAVPPPAKAVEKPATEAPKPEKRPKKKRRRWPWVVAAIAAVLCIGTLLCMFVGVPLLNQRQRRRTATAATAMAEKPAEKLLEEARAAREAGNLGDAVELYKQAAEADPGLILAYLEASDLLMIKEDADSAIDILEQGIEANPDEPALHEQLGGIAILAGKWEKAEKEVRWMLQDAPEQATPHAYAAVLTLEQNEPCEKARPQLDAALERDPNSAWAHYGVALCHYQEGDLETTRAELKFVLDHKEAPPHLKKHAEEMLSMLETAPEESIEVQFEIVLSLGGEIPDDELRQQFKDMLDQARRAWQEGNAEETRRIAKEAITWVRENSDGIGGQLSRRLTFRLTLIVRLAEEPPPP